MQMQLTGTDSLLLGCSIFAVVLCKLLSLVVYKKVCHFPAGMRILVCLLLLRAFSPLKDLFFSGVQFRIQLRETTRAYGETAEALLSRRAGALSLQGEPPSAIDVGASSEASLSIETVNYIRRYSDAVPSLLNTWKSFSASVFSLVYMLYEIYRRVGAAVTFVAAIVMLADTAAKLANRSRVRSLKKDTNSREDDLDKLVTLAVAEGAAAPALYSAYTATNRRMLSLSNRAFVCTSLCDIASTVLFNICIGAVCMSACGQENSPLALGTFLVFLKKMEKIGIRLTKSFRELGEAEGSLGTKNTNAPMPSLFGQRGVEARAG